MATTVTPAAAGDFDDLRALFREYAAWLQVDYCLKNFEAELAGLPGACVPPAGGLWIARVEGAPAGCVALQPLSDGASEMKRLWVRPPYRGMKLGRRLAETALNAARVAGQRRVVLETLDVMTTARALYGDLGFREVANGDAPDNVRRLERDLAAAPAI